MFRGVAAVLLDFYGTLARNADPTFEIDEVLAKRGYELPDILRDRMWNGDLDGIEHVDESRSREHYAAWQQQRLLALLTDADVHPAEHDIIVAELEAGRGSRELRAYPEVAETLRALRARGLRLAICSNWDWDLELAVEEAGLAGSVDLLVSSAWAGARKPHPRIFRHTLEQLDLGPHDVVFVGDTWGPDVDGPRALDICAVYLERDGHWPDSTLPSAPASEIARIRDLTGLLELL
jgi:putative hydrolase of the HAD superfamily